jgi:hypothetical protein
VTHTYIYICDDIYTLDTSEERELAARHMREAGVMACPVWRGGPDLEMADDREFRSDGWFYVRES